ncbi:MAG: hypothetical protein HY300_03645 [Verrucomicrobia bacterium]|nr:hypothetical protein [Verrucomicrobiota bacterium]
MCRALGGAGFALALGGVVLRLSAAFEPNQFDTFESHSQQFFVTGLRPGVFIGMPDGSRPPANFIRLEPAVVVVNCERVKDALLRELRLKDQWHGRIRVTLAPDMLPTQPAVVNREHYRDGWQYRMFVPHFAEPPALARAITGALLLELANRNNPTDHAGEVPLWAIEGMAAHLLATGKLIFLEGSSAPVLATGRFNVITDPRAVFIVSSRIADPYQEPRARLHLAGPLSFNDLSQPRAEQLRGESREIFRSSAHVFVSELMKLPDGPAGFAEFLRQLPNFLNAQLAFQRAFGQHFQNTLDIEKWWSLTLVNIVGRDAQQRWTQPTSLDKLDDLLVAHVEWRVRTNALPEHRAIKLQQFLGQADFAQERVAMAELIAQLTALQNQASPELARLVADYRRTLDTYLKKRDKAGQGFTIANRMAPSHRVAISDAARQLDLLDVIREDFHRFDPGARRTAAQK